MEQTFSNFNLSNDPEKPRTVDSDHVENSEYRNGANGYPERTDQLTNGTVTLQQEINEINRTLYHFPKLPVFVNKLKEAYACRDLKKTDPYKNVFALLIQWADDDLGVKGEIGKLEEMLRVTYKFTTKTWLIPSGKKRYTDLFQTVSSFLSNDTGDTLFILYYGGHAYQDVHSQPIWVSNRDRALECKSSGIFPLFEELQGDALLLFDTCQALPHDFDCHGNGIVAALTSTGFEPGPISAAAGVGRDSFTSALIEELGILSRPKYPSRQSQPFSHLTLYSQLVSRLRLTPRNLGRKRDGTWKRDDDGHHTLQPYQRRTPVHHFLSRNKEHRPIMLLPRSNGSSAQITKEINSNERSIPFVLVSIRLRPDTLDHTDIESWIKWLSSLPNDAKVTEIEGRDSNIDAVYTSHSTLMVMTIPLETWSLMHKDPAMTFIGYVYGKNKAQEINDRIVSRLTSSQHPDSQTMSTDGQENTPQDNEWKRDYLIYRQVLSHDTSKAAEAASLTIDFEQLCMLGKPLYPSLHLCMAYNTVLIFARIVELVLSRQDSLLTLRKIFTDIQSSVGHFKSSTIILSTILVWLGVFQSGLFGNAQWISIIMLTIQIVFVLYSASTQLYMAIIEESLQFSGLTSMVICFTEVLCFTLVLLPKPQIYDIFKLLVEMWVSSTAQDISGWVPLSWALEFEDYSIIKTRLGNGTDIECRDLLGQTLLSWASGTGNEAVVNLLLENGANIEAQDKSGRTPLSRASGIGNEAVVNLLLENGASIEAQDKSGRTPFSWAAETGNEAVINLLLENGANIEAQDKSGRTPLSWAEGSGSKAVVKLLLEKGAEVNVPDNSIIRLTHS